MTERKYTTIEALMAANDAEIKGRRAPVGAVRMCERCGNQTPDWEHLFCNECKLVRDDEFGFVQEQRLEDKRDTFAIAVLQAVIGAGEQPFENDMPATCRAIYAWADAMMVARNKGTQ
jgi:hypothetical protein